MANHHAQGVSYELPLVFSRPYNRAVMVQCYDFEFRKEYVGMRTVSRFEANLLTILRCIVGQAPRSQGLQALAAKLDQPHCLSRDCLELVQQTLANGCVLMLARDDWSQQRFLRGQTATSGRLWERTRPEELGVPFSVATLQFLLVLTGKDVRGKRWSRGIQPRQLGDQLLIFLAMRAFANSDYSWQWPQQSLFRENPLCALAYPEHFTAEGAAEIGFRRWFAEGGMPIVEALQTFLAARWIEVEVGKQRLTRAEALRNVGSFQEHVLREYLAAIDEIGRRDLARFLLIVGQEWLSGVTAEQLRPKVETTGLRLSERMELTRAAGALLRQFQTLQAWQQQAQSVGYFDEGYQASQLWKADWEQYQAGACSESSALVLRELEPFAGVATQAQSAK